MNLNPQSLTKERANEITEGKSRSATSFSGTLYTTLKELEPGDGVKFGPLDTEKQVKKLRRAIGPATISLGWFAGYAPPNKEGEEHGRRLSAYYSEITVIEENSKLIDQWYLEIVRKPQLEE